LNALNFFRAKKILEPECMECIECIELRAFKAISICLEEIYNRSNLIFNAFFYAFD